MTLSGARGVSLDIRLGPQGEISEAAAARRSSIAIAPWNGHGHDHRFDSPLSRQSIESDLSSCNTEHEGTSSRYSTSPPCSTCLKSAKQQEQPQKLGQFGRPVIGRLAEAGISAVSGLETERFPFDAAQFLASRRGCTLANLPPTAGAALPRRGLLGSVTPPRRDSLRSSVSSDDDELSCVRALLTAR